MKYVSLDVETTCLNDRHPENLLAFSLIVEDTERPDIAVEDLPSITYLVEQRTYKGEAYAMAMNSWIFDQLSGRKPAIYPIISRNLVDGVALTINQFLDHHFTSNQILKGKIPVAGCQVGTFDLPFLPKEVRKRFHYRTLELASVCWDGESLRGLDDLKKHYNIPGPVTHDPWEDAADVIRILRAHQQEKKS